MSSEQDLCIVSHPLGNGGGTALKSLLRVIKPNADPSVVVLGEYTPENDGIELTSVGSEYGNQGIISTVCIFLLNQIRLARHLASRPEETVLFFGATTYLLPILVARAVGKTVAVEPRGHLARSLYFEFRDRLPDPIARALSAMVYILDRTGMVIANYVITLSPGMASDLGLDPTSPTVLPNGAWDVDHKKFSIVNPPAKRERTIAFIGRFEPEKGIDRMVTITDAISSETTVRFIGDGSGRELIERELHEPINTGQVIIDGWVDHDELPNLLNQCRLLVVPSRTEGLPTTILEAFACGVSAAATPVAGIPDIVHDEETGIHINSDTPERTAERIDQLLESEYIELGKSGRDLVESEYTFQQAVDRYEKIIETICT